MKITYYQQLCLFTIYLLFCSVFTNVHGNVSNVLLKTSLKGYFWIQRMYPGKDPIENLKESEFNSRRMFFEVNDEIVYFREKENNKEDIEDSINLVDLFDDKIDDASAGKCCTRIAYEEFPAGNSLTTIIPAIPATVKGKAAVKLANKPNPKVIPNPANKSNPVLSPSFSRKKEKKIHNPESNANFCLNLWIPEEARWRICHESQQEISKLQLKITYSVLKSKLNPKNKNGMLEKFLNQFKVGAVDNVEKWSWEDQNKWGGKCQITNNLQSPINLIEGDAIKPEKNFSLSLHLTDVHTLVKKNFDEVIVAFLNLGGIVKLNVENTYLLFIPQFMSFRFPGESIVNGKRSSGDILLHFAELSSERKTATTSGMVLTIPIEADTQGHTLDNIDKLNLEFWKYELGKHGTYSPRKFFKKKLLKFGLEEFANKILAMKPNFLLYFGSNTTPPCNENVIHIVADKALKIPGCQFKLLRENSLNINKVKTIHSRLEKPANNRVVYSVNKLGYIPSLSGIVPQSFNKYLITHGPSYMAKLFFKYGPHAKGGKYGRWFKKYGKPWWAKKGIAGKIPGDSDTVDCSVEKH